MSKERKSLISAKEVDRLLKKGAESAKELRKILDRVFRAPKNIRLK